jgi:outer membrane biosynthesis protein TonB
MRNRVATLAATVLLVQTTRPGGQTPPSASAVERKITSRVDPVYPDLARKMHIRGIVRIEATAGANGAVKSTRALGGNPVLVDARLDAVGKWKFELLQSETTQVVQVSFDGQ